MWATLCTLMDQLPLTELEHEVLPYIRTMTARASSHQPRPLPRLWARRTKHLDNLPQLSLINIFSLDAEQLAHHVIPDLLTYLQHHPTQTQALGFRGPIFQESATDINALISQQENLNTLKLNNTHILNALHPDHITPWCSHLHSLSLHEPNLTPGQFARFIQTPTLHTLALGLPGHEEDARTTIDILHHDTNLHKRLKKLEITGPTPWTSLGQRYHREHFDRLQLNQQHLLERQWKSLHTLTLREWNIPSSFSSSWRQFDLPELHTLRLESCVLDDEAFLGIMRALKDSPLEHLHVVSCRVTWRGVKRVLDELDIRLNLKTLNLTANPLLAQHDIHQNLFHDALPWPKLENLILASTALTMPETSYLEDEHGRPLFPALQKLVISSCNVSEMAFYNLTRSEFPALRTFLAEELLDVHNTIQDPLSEQRQTRQLLSAQWLPQLGALSLPPLTWNHDSFQELAATPFTHLQELLVSKGNPPKEFIKQELISKASWSHQLKLLRPETADAPHYDDRIAPMYHELVHQTGAAF